MYSGPNIENEFVVDGLLLSLASDVWLPILFQPAQNIQPGKKYSYKLDAAVLRNTSKIHFSAYITINGIDYGFDGESYSRLEKFNWKSKLNKNTQWRFAEQYETYFNFTKGYQILIYYRDS